MGSILPNDVASKPYHNNAAGLKLELESFASTALSISVQDLRPKVHKSWLALGGDSLTAVNFVGSCYGAGIDVDIPDVLQAESLADLFDLIALSQRPTQPTSNGTNDRVYTAHSGPSLDALCQALGIPADGVQAIGPCSPMQENFIALQSIDPAAYQLQLSLKISATNSIRMDTDSFAKAWRAVVNRHPALRTMFVESADRPGKVDQVVCRNTSPQITVLSTPEAESRLSFEAYGTRFPHHLILASTPDRKLFVKLNISHAIADATSIEVLFRDLFRALTGTLPVDEYMQCDDFMQAQQPDVTKEALSYWSHYTAASESSFLSHSGSKTSPVGLYTIDQEMTLPPDLLQAFTEQSNATLVNACQAAWALVLRCYTGSSNVSFSYTASGRQKRIKGLQDAVGLFVNTLPCHVQLDQSTTVAEVLQRAQRDFLQSLPYQGADLTDSQQDSGIAVREVGDSLLAFQSAVPETELADAGFGVDLVSWEAPSDYNYTLAVTLDKHRLSLRLSVWESLTQRENALNLLQLFRDSLDFVLQNTSKSCSDFVGLTEQDRSKILASNGTAFDVPRNCVHSQVWDTIRRQPDLPAVYAWDGELTYRELGEMARRLSSELLSLGVGPECRIGVCMDKSRLAPVVMLAILQAGGVVVPLGTRHPLSRIQTIVHNADMAILLADPVHAKRLEGIVQRTVVVDHSYLSELSSPPETLVWPTVSPDNAAWIVYTSGSTGIPKGVVLEHKTVCGPMPFQSSREKIDVSTRALQFSDHTFDATAKDIFTTLSCGGCICIPSEKQRLEDLGEAIRKMGVNYATITPTVASLLDLDQLPTLETVVLTGEALNFAIIQPWLEKGRARWFNAYGPSECSIITTIYGPIIRSEDVSNIGFAAANRLWITHPSDHNQLSPIGAVGELLVEGAIAREYLHDPAKTAAAFVLDPDFVKELGLAPGRRMYRTGDLVRQNKDGSLIYLGRRDTQIKIRGQRVEVGEIESRISQSLPENPLVCVDLMRLSNSHLDSSVLVAAISMRDATSPSKPAPGTLCTMSEDLKGLLQSLHAKLVDELPLYMVPAFLLPFCSLPTNVSAKLDRKLSRAIVESLTEEKLTVFMQKDGHGAITTETEKSLQATWAEVLKRPVDEIGRDDHFFHLGGDSVIAMRMASISKRKNVPVSVADILQNPRLADLARVVDNYDVVAEKVAREDPVPFELWDGFLAADPDERKGRLVDMATQCSVSVDAVEDVYPVSPLQEGLMAMTSQSSGTYVAQQVYRIDSAVDLKRFRQAWTDAASLMPILRTRIVYTSATGSMQVVVKKPPQWSTTAADLSTFIQDDREASFAYGTALHRFAIVSDNSNGAGENQSQGTRYFIWTSHHSAYDGHTVAKIFRTFIQQYTKTPVDVLTPIPRFIRFIQEQGRMQAEDYWKKELENAELTTFPPSPKPTYRPSADGVSRHRFELLGRLKVPNNHGSGVSSAMLLRAAWALVVASQTASNEAMLAVVLSGRDAPVFGIEDLVAPTVTTVLARIRIQRNQTVADFLSSVDSQNKTMAPHTQFGLANIRRAVPGLGHDFDSGHLFHVQPGWGDDELSAAQSIGLDRLTGDRGNFEGYGLVVECTLEAGGAGVEVEMRFDENMLSTTHVAALMSQLEHVVQQLQLSNHHSTVLDATQRDITVGQLDLISPLDKKKILSWNRPPPDPAQTTVDSLIQKQITDHPDAPAVCARDGELTYTQLDSSASRLAQHLVSLGVGPETYVGLCMDKGKFAVVAMVAILRAGGAVVPLGVQYPDSRIKTVVADAKMTVVLVDGLQASRFKSMVCHAVVANSSLIASLPVTSALTTPRATPSNPAWVIYTSGSTGVPKGVVLEHQAMCSSIFAHGARYSFGRSTRTLQFSAFTFDVSIQDNMTTLAFGGCVCLPSEADRTDALASTMGDMQVTLATLTPTVTSLLDPQTVPASLDTIIFVGEAVKPDAVKPWIGRCAVFNGYGPAECSIYSVINGPVLRAQDAPIIGSPVSNRLWIASPLDHNSLVPPGTPGELLIEGPMLAREYLHNLGKTQESFVLDPNFITSFGLPPGRRMYRTGDLVVQDRENGLLECLGRIDTQIKIRGQRVETGEIESQIVQLHSAIQYACVDLVQLQEAPDPTLLVAVELSEAFHHDYKDDEVENDHPESVQLPDAIHQPSHRLRLMFESLRSELLQVLPVYMIPSHFIPMTLPVNASGKLDRRATKRVLECLSREQLRAFTAEHARKTDDGVLSETEKQLCILWAEVLGLPAEEIRSGDDDFFQLGGDSVAAMRLVAAADRATIPIKLGVAQVLQNSRLSDMAQAASEAAADAMAAVDEDPLPFELWGGFINADLQQQEARLAAVVNQCEDLTKADEIADVYPSTPLQEGMMAITSQQISAYMVQQVFRVGANVDLPRLEWAWNQLSEKLPMLRTRIAYTAQGAVQVVASKAPSWKSATGLHSYLKEDQSQPFAYGTPLHRLAIVKDKTGDYLVWTGHHAAYDGWSLTRVLSMFSNIYQNEESNFAVAPMSRFVEYLQWVDKDDMAAFWKSQLGNAQLTRFPLLPSPTYQPKAVDIVQLRLNDFGKKGQKTSLLRAAWAMTVAIYTGSNDAIVNVSLSGRDIPVLDIDNIIGPTITTVPVRTKLDKEQTVEDFLAAVDQQAKDMAPYAHAGLQEIRKVVPGIASDWDAGHLFIIQPAPTSADGVGLERIGLELDTGMVEAADFGGYALAVDCTVDADAVAIDIRFDRNVLSPSTAAALLSHFEHNIRQLENHEPGTCIGDLHLITPHDASIIRQWNQDVPSTTYACIHDRIQASVDKSPDTQAVCAWDGDFSYAALHYNARKVAHHLASQRGVGPDITVGLSMDKSRWAIVSILAILMAGGAVTPLGTQQPLARVSTIAKDSQISVIMVDASQATRLALLEGISPNLIIVDAAWVDGLLSPSTTEPVCKNVTPDNAAWLVYTSGSTGVPKGVVLEHKALCSSFNAHGPRVGFDTNTRALQFSAFTFDNSIEETLSVLTFGGCVCVPSEDQRLNATAEAICHLSANLINTTPTVASLIQPADVPMLKTLLLGGEGLSPAVVEHWLGHAKIINTYGPAECSVDVACSAPMQHPSEASTIGLPLGVNFWVASASDYNRLVPIGVPGQLLVEGPHLGRGYLNDADKTAKAFVWDPDFVNHLGISPGRRMYLTGDLVQQNTDGSLVHLGRIDAQIKIRGQRVETGEIESNIIRLQRDIQIACVDLVPVTDAPDQILIAAIAVGDYGRDNDETQHTLPPLTVRKPTDALGTMIRDLRAALLQVLPRYMVPQFVPMASLPQNSSSKLDRRATRTILADLSRQQIIAFERTSESAESRILSPLEDRLRRLWVQVLDCSPEIGAQDDFIQLGGDSVTAMRLVAAARAADIRIGVADILQNPRLEDLARLVENNNTTIATEQDPAAFELWGNFTTTTPEEQKGWLSTIAERCNVASIDIEDAYPATPLQEGLMAMTAQRPGVFVAQNVFRVRQDMDIERFNQAWATLEKSLPILRTRIVYHSAQTGTVQVVQRNALEWYHGTDLQEYLAADKTLSFGYGTPLHRLAMVEIADKKKYFVWTQHHSGYDGYQMALMLDLLARLYQDGGSACSALPPIPRFIKYLQQNSKEQTAAYWKEQLGDAAVIRFPPLPHPMHRPHADGLLERRVSRGKLREGNPAAPVSSLLRAAWATTVAAYTKSTESTSTVALSGRDVPVLDIGNMVVPTMTAVPFRTRLDNGAQLVSELLGDMDRQNEEMKPFLHTGIQHIRAAVPGLGFDFDPGHLFMVQPSVGDDEDDPLPRIGLEEVAIDKAGFGGDALTIQCIVNTDRTVDIEMRFDQEVLTLPMAEALLSQFEHAIQELETHIDSPIGELDLLKPADVERVQRWNHPVLHATPNRSCIHELVQRMVEKQPHTQAVLSWDGELSYAALSQAACRLAHHLQDLGVRPEMTVGVCMGKSRWAMVSMLAILQAGAVVVALDPQHPLSRYETVIADAGIRVTLIDKSQVERLQSVPQPVVVDASFIERLPPKTALPESGVTPDHAAWIIYTSGSTGTPKGVVLEHKALCTGIIAHGTLFGNDVHTRALQFASHTFGVVIEDMFTTLIFGGCTCIPSDQERLDMDELPGAMRRMHVNFVNLTSTAASLIDPHEVPEVKTAVLGGEAVKPSVLQRWINHAKVLNAYGQSECAVESVISLLEQDGNAANIGSPIAGCAAWVVDSSDYNRLVPVGAPGQLLIQGPLLARGYLGDHDKTAASFVSNPGFLERLGFSCGPASRMYCTGDLVQQNFDGSLVYLGRVDDQIKVKGQRMEPGEVESHITQVDPSISQALVDLVTPRDSSTSTSPVLVAAIHFHQDVETVTSSLSETDLPSTIRPPTKEINARIQQLRTALLKTLPSYMVPGFFIAMTNRLPVNASGKLDRRAARSILGSLTRGQLAAFANVEKGPTRALSAIEEQLRAAYAEVLGCRAEDIGPDDPFTELGGDSIAAMRVVAVCRKEGMGITVRDLLMSQSISVLALCVDDEGTGSDEPLERSSKVTDVEEWVLNYHTARPDIGRTWFALDASGPLIGDKMADACRKLLTSIEVLHTGFVKERGEWKRVVLSPFIPDVPTYTIDGSIDEWTEDYMRREAPNTIIQGRPLADIAICTTTLHGGQHRILFNISHGVWDGVCISTIWSTLQNLYETGQAPSVACFSQYVAQVEKRRTPEAFAYWTNLLKDSTVTSLTPQDNKLVWRAGVKGPKIIPLGKNLPSGTTCANLVKAAWALVLGRHGNTHDVVFADGVSGRAGIDASVAGAVGCASTPMPVRVKLDPALTYEGLVYAVKEQQLQSMPYETFGFDKITRNCTDWPQGTNAPSWLNHVPSRHVGFQLDFGGTDYTVCQPSQEEKNWTFSETRISWLNIDNNLEFSLAYAAEKLPESVAQSLYDDFALIVERVLTSPRDLIGEQLSDM